MPKYNGHRNYNRWNVSLWINNDEGLYRRAVGVVRRAKNKDDAARQFMDDLAEAGITKTPDGVRYTVTAVRAALAGM